MAHGKEGDCSGAENQGTTEFHSLSLEVGLRKERFLFSITLCDYATATIDFPFPKRDILFHYCDLLCLQ